MYYLTGAVNIVLL